MSKITIDGRFNPVWHRMLYICTHMATVSVKGLNEGCGLPGQPVTDDCTRMIATTNTFRRRRTFRVFRPTCYNQSNTRRKTLSPFTKLYESSIHPSPCSHVWVTWLFQTVTTVDWRISMRYDTIV